MRIQSITKKGDNPNGETTRTNTQHWEYACSTK